MVTVRHFKTVTVKTILHTHTHTHTEKEENHKVKTGDAKKT